MEQDQTFAGREDALSRLYQKPATFTLLGRRYIGKTAFLRHIQAVSYPDTIGIYIPLKLVDAADEQAWLSTLAHSIMDSVMQRGYGYTGIEDMPQDAETLRGWIAQRCLPTLFRLIRPDYKLMLLLDDISELTIPNGYTYLHSLLSPELSIIMTLDIRYEDDLAAFAPLIVPENTFRLGSLKEQTTQKLLRHLTVDPLAVHKATGGEPALIRRYQYYLEDGLPLADVQTTVYHENHDFFDARWHQLSPDERLVFAALCNRAYEDPLQAITPTMLESWLIQTDYPLDTTAINAALRGLEYHDLVQRTASHIQIASELMRNWVLEHGHSPLPPSSDAGRQPAIWVIMLVVITASILIILLIAEQSTNPNPGDAPVATITLIPDN